MATPLNSVDEIHNRIQTLAGELESATPNIAGSILKIWQDLKASPELVHVLSEDEVSIIARGLSTQSQVQLIDAKMAKPSKAAANKKLADLEI